MEVSKKLKLTKIYRVQERARRESCSGPPRRLPIAEGGSSGGGDTAASAPLAFLESSKA
jgi:hypothetical protein